MVDPIKCICGYRGPSVPEGEFQVCPICRGRVRGSNADWRGLPIDASGEPAAAPAPLRVDEPTTHHIPCPRGHVLKARSDMLGEEVCCPQCNEFFVLRASDSVEFRRQQARMREEAEARAARAWLQRAIVVALLIGLSFVAMLVIGLNPGLVRR